jgi:hypothetical protein
VPRGTPCFFFVRQRRAVGADEVAWVRGFRPASTGGAGERRGKTAVPWERARIIAKRNICVVDGLAAVKDNKPAVQVPSARLELELEKTCADGARSADFVGSSRGPSRRAQRRTKSSWIRRMLRKTVEVALVREVGVERPSTAEKVRARGIARGRHIVPSKPVPMVIIRVTQAAQMRGGQRVEQSV